MANTSNSYANSTFANTTLSDLNVSDLTVDTSNVGNTQISVGDVFDTGATNLGTEFTGITADQITADGPPDNEMVDSIINGANHAPQKIPDKRFHPQPGSSAPGSEYLGEFATMMLNSAGKPSLGMMGKRNNKPVTSQASTHIPTTTPQNAVGSTGSSQKGHNQRLNESSRDKGSRSGKGTITKECTNPLKIFPIDNNSKVVVLCDDKTKAHKTFALKNAGDTIKIVNNTTVKSGDVMYVFACCKRKPIKDKGYGENEVDPRLAEATDARPYSILMKKFVKNKNVSNENHTLETGQAPTDAGPSNTQTTVTGNSPDNIG